jgi:lysocardiolipin and lysophospholipid acyltransferase
MVLFHLLMNLGNLTIYVAQLPFLLVFPLAPGLFRSAMRANERVWASLIIWLTQTFIPTGIVVTGDELDASESVLLLSNHLMYADWWYLWHLAYMYGAHGHVKIILKKALSKVPVVGWAMRNWEFIFLARDWKKDQPVLEGATGSFGREKTPIWLLIFPEGTVISRERYTAAEEFAASRPGTQLHRNLLLPRTLGALTCLKRMPHLGAVVDVTLGYEGLPGRTSIDAEKHFTLGRIFGRADPPKIVHMHIRRFDIEDVPTGDDDFAKWMNDLFRSKDALLDTFYRTGSFEDKRGKKPARTLTTPSTAGVFSRLGLCVAFTVLLVRWIRHLIW